MNVALANRMQHMRASEIREMLKVTQRPEVISFAGGLPAPESFPVEELKEVTRRVLEEEGPRALQYSTTEGHAPLRSRLAARLTARLDADVPADRVLVTTGSQQGLDLLGKVFLDEGDEVVCESPTYLGAINALRAFAPRFVEVRTDDEGMVPDDLAARLAACRRPKLIYVVPDFQNPSGRCWTRPRREALLAIAARFGVPVVEDAPYRELRYEGDEEPALLALDGDDLVVHLGTASKIFCPGMRIGWMVAPAGLFDKFVLVKQGADLHTSSFTQIVFDTYLASHDLDAAIVRIRALYRRRRDAMLAAIAREFPPGVRTTHPAGGLFLWAELAEGVNARAVLARCLELDVAFVPGGSFFPNGGHENTLRLNFSNMPEDRIRDGIARLGAVLRDVAVAARGISLARQSILEEAV